MKHLSKLFAVAAVLAVATVFAGPGKRGPDMNETHTNITRTNIVLGPLAHYDTDTNGIVSSNEFSAASVLFAQKTLTNFLAKYDGNTNGAVTSAEVLAVTQAYAERWVTNVLAHYDRNSDGTLNTNEVRRFHTHHDGPTLAEIDVDKNGVISQAELVAAGLALAEDRQEQILTAFDTNKDGTIAGAEVLAIFQAEADERTDEILERFDADDDGNVTAVEISAIRPSRPGGRGGPGHR